MPKEQISNGTKELSHLCRRCSILEPEIIVRTEPLCKTCFVKYVHTKVIKRMEAFRAYNSTFGKERNLLVPLSLGASSLTLLHVLSHYQARQFERTGHPSFSLKVVCVQEPSWIDDSWEQAFELVKKRYHQHSYFVATLPNLIDVKEYCKIANGILEIEGDGQDTSMAQLTELLDLLPSATSRADVLSILKTRAITNAAKEHQCEAILWGDSTTRLAERTIAETAKGRGFSLPWQVTDGKLPQGESYYFPMRDLLKKEIVAHAPMSEPPLVSLLFTFPSKQSPTTSRSSTIDDLVRQYFKSVEESYPSVVANVVRTSGKLRALRPNEKTRVCKLCHMPVVDGILGIHGWGGDQSNSVRARDEQLCYGCSRSVPRHARI